MISVSKTNSNVTTSAGNGLKLTQEGFNRSIDQIGTLREESVGLLTEIRDRMAREAEEARARG